MNLSVCVLGANGFIGKNLLRGKDTWVGVTRKDLDLLDQHAVDEFFKKKRWDVVIHCGASLDQESHDTCYKNILMFENVARNIEGIGKLIYFSSGAGRRGNPPTDPYGLSKWIVDKRIAQINDAYSLCIWGCYGPHELSSRFSAICARDGHVVLEKDRYFDFIDVEDVKKEVDKCIDDSPHKFVDLVYPERLKLSEWALKFGATCEILDTSSLDPSYVAFSHGELKTYPHVISNVPRLDT